MSILPPRDYGGDDEARRLAATLDDLGEKMLRAVDAACRLRTAPGDAKRLRQYMRRNLEEAALNGMGALAYASQTPKGD